MDVASLDLCKELYKLSGWTGGWRSLVYCQHGTECLVADSMEVISDEIVCPAYSLGYLLRNLPTDTSTLYLLAHEEIHGVGQNDKWVFYERIWLETNEIDATLADTPEDAVAKLAIELFKQGILERAAED